MRAVQPAAGNVRASSARVPLLLCLLLLSPSALLFLLSLAHLRVFPEQDRRDSSRPNKGSTLQILLWSHLSSQVSSKLPNVSTRLKSCGWNQLVSAS